MDVTPVPRPFVIPSENGRKKHKRRENDKHKKKDRRRAGNDGDDAGANHLDIVA